MLEVLILLLVTVNLLNVILYFIWIGNQKIQHNINHKLSLEMAELQREWHSNQKEINKITEIRNKEAHEHLIKSIDEGKIQLINPS